jgi:hypothetical protein
VVPTVNKKGARIAAPRAPRHWGADSTAADQSQLPSPTVEQAHCPRARFSASVLIRVICAGAAAPSREVPFAVRLGVPTRAGDLGISVRHAVFGHRHAPSASSPSRFLARARQPVGRTPRRSTCCSTVLPGTVFKVGAALPASADPRGRRVGAQRTLKPSGGSGTGLLHCKG